MSEYQYYEFRAIDRPLSAADQAYLRSLSTRADITSRRFVNEYDFGSFKGSPIKLMHRCFDLHTYWANWGSRVLMIRLPIEAVPSDDLACYKGPSFSVDRTADHMVLTFSASIDDWDEDWTYEDLDFDWAGQLEPIRQLLLAGDLRPLYLAWLGGVPYDDDDAVEPPVPGGLKELPPCLDALVKFIGVDTDLIMLASDRSPQPQPPNDCKASVRRWLQKLSTAEKDDLLLQTLLDESIPATAAASKAYQQHLKQTRSPVQHVGGATAKELLETAELMREKRQQEAAEERRVANAAKAKAAAAKRSAQLRKLAASYDEQWRAVDELVLMGVSTYPAVATALLDLRDAAGLVPGKADFGARLDLFVQKYSRRHSLMERLRKGKLIP